MEKLPEVLAAEVLPRLYPADLAVLAQVGRPWLAAVVASGLARAGKSEGLPLKITAFFGSAERLAWAKANGCPWVARTCAWAARSGSLEVLRWARANDCPWDAVTCAWAAGGGHLEVLIWAWEHGCPWERADQVDEADEEDELYGYSMNCCALAALGGHLEVLKWLWEHGCPMDVWTLCECR